jgi:hypothetical protein
MVCFFLRFCSVCMCMRACMCVYVHVCVCVCVCVCVAGVGRFLVALSVRFSCTPVRLRKCWVCFALETQFKNSCTRLDCSVHVCLHLNIDGFSTLRRGASDPGRDSLQRGKQGDVKIVGGSRNPGCIPTTLEVSPGRFSKVVCSEPCAGCCLGACQASKLLS